LAPHAVLPDEALFMLTKGYRQTTCRLKYHAEHGGQAQFLEVGNPVFTPALRHTGASDHWAELEREALCREGWTLAGC
jgi:hypothetical protein